MSLIAGIDVGNSTTEVVIADADGRPLAWDRRPTRGVKGSSEAADGAAALLRRLQRRADLHVDRVVLTPQVPVHTYPVSVSPPPTPLGCLTVLGTGSATPGGGGYAVGRPVAVEDGPHAGDGPVIVVSRDRVGFRLTIERVQRWQAAGVDVRGVLLAGDEAVLVGARLQTTMPVLDGLDAEAALRCRLVAVEVAAPGAPLASLTDPIRLAHDLGLGVDEIEHAHAAAAELRGHRCAAIGLLTVATPDGGPAEGMVASLRTGESVPLSALQSALHQSTVGLVERLLVPGQDGQEVDDAWVVDLAQIESLPGLRAGDVPTRDVVIAALTGAGRRDDPRAAFGREWALVDVVASEAAASRLGGLSTPGAPADTWVIDLGGGTLDAVDHDGRTVVAAGCGDLLTVATARTLGISRGAAEWVKRGPASHVDAPHVVTDESGERRFLDAAAPLGTVGWLVADGPSGPLPFSRRLAVAQWRAIRLELKQRAVADNLHRVLASFDHIPEHVLLQGGPAGDSELLQTLNAALAGTVVGRADVAGRLGHRWAVAYGLVLAAIGLDVMDLPPGT